MGRRLNPTEVLALCGVLLAFALYSRERYRLAAASLAAAVLLKQFAAVAIPFLAVMLVQRRLGRAELLRVAASFAAVLVVGVLPFAAADPLAFYEDTVEFGAGTYRIVGYGLSAILVRLGVVADRECAYPFLTLALLLWLPLTLWLLRQQWRSREPWRGAAAFSISLLVLLFIGRTFNNYYLLWPAMGAVAAAMLAAGERGDDRWPESLPGVHWSERRPRQEDQRCGWPTSCDAETPDALASTSMESVSPPNLGRPHARNAGHPVIRDLPNGFTYCYPHREYF